VLSGSVFFCATVSKKPANMNISADLRFSDLNMCTIVIQGASYLTDIGGLTIRHLLPRHPGRKAASLAGSKEVLPSEDPTYALQHPTTVAMTDPGAPHGRRWTATTGKLGFSRKSAYSLVLIAGYDQDCCIELWWSL
jgi:hypothetical protein